MAVSADRKFTKQQVFTILEGAKGKTLGEVDKSHQFARTEKSEKITGIAGDVVEQSVNHTILSNEHQNSHHRLTPPTFQQSYLGSLVADIRQSKMYRCHHKAILHLSTYDNADTLVQILCCIQKLSSQD